MKARSLVLVLDSVGAGHAPDAAAYGDEGANTLGHILREKDALLGDLRGFSCVASRVAGFFQVESDWSAPSSAGNR